MSKYYNPRGCYDNPEDPGVFIASWRTQELMAESLAGVTRFYSARDNGPLIKFHGCRYFVQVGGGHQGFKRLACARAFANSPN